jgi:hypothetical protein
VAANEKSEAAGVAVAAAVREERVEGDILLMVVYQFFNTPTIQFCLWIMMQKKTAISN